MAVTRSAPSLLSGDLAGVQTEVEKRHDESIQRLQHWIRNPSISAEDRGMDEGCELLIRMAREAGFQKAARIDTDGHPGVFATLDAGAPRTFGLYFMYDVKQADPAEWSSPPFDAAIVDKPGFGRVLMGRGAVNQKGPEAAFLAASIEYLREKLGQLSSTPDRAYLSQWCGRRLDQIRSNAKGREPEFDAARTRALDRLRGELEPPKQGGGEVH